MAFDLKDIVPWGRSFEEYVSMFSLNDVDFDKKILGCGDGPAGFNADAVRRGYYIVSVDPIYRLPCAKIKRRIDAVFSEILDQTEKNKNDFLWNSIRSVDELGMIRMKSMDAFLRDYESGKAQGRYLEGELPNLNFEDNEFDLSLCSHFLFLYSDHHDLDFHIRSIENLLRISWEIRIFPLLKLNSQCSQHLNPVVDYLVANGYFINIEKVNYEFQRGGNEMLKITKIESGKGEILPPPPHTTGHAGPHPAGC